MLMCYIKMDGSRKLVKMDDDFDRVKYIILPKEHLIPYFRCFSIKEIHITDCIQYNSECLMNVSLYLKSGEIKVMT